MTRIADSQKGPLRCWLDANQEWLQTMRPSERNALLRAAAIRAVMDLRHARLKALFTDAVLKPPFNYTKDMLTPLLASGKMRNLVLNGSKPYATAKTDASGTQMVRVVLRMDYGHIVGPEIAAVMKIVPDEWVQFVCDRFAIYINIERAKMVSSSTSSFALQGNHFGLQHHDRLRLDRNQRTRFQSIRANAAAIRLKSAHTKKRKSA